MSDVISTVDVGEKFVVTCPVLKGFLYHGIDWQQDKDKSDMPCRFEVTSVDIDECKDEETGEVEDHVSCRIRFDDGKEMWAGENLLLKNCLRCRDCPNDCPDKPVCDKKE